MSAAMALSAHGLSPMASFRVPTLPWSNAADDERRFQRIAWSVVLLALLLGVVVPWLPLPVRERIEAQPLPAPMARLLLERVATPPAPPPPPKVDTPELAEAPKPAPEQPAPVKPVKPREAPVPEARNPEPGKPPGEVARDNARRKASGVGLLAMKNELAAMTGAPVAVQLRQDLAPGPGVGSGSGPGVGAGQDAGLPSRALITSNATQGSGGINTAAYSRDTGGGGLAGRATTLVEGVAGGGGGGGPGGGGGRAGAGKGGDGGAGQQARAARCKRAAAARAAGPSKTSSWSSSATRAPSTRCTTARCATTRAAGQGGAGAEDRARRPGAGLRIVSSELKAEELEGKLLARIRQFDFGAKDVDLMVVTWPVDFLPIVGLRDPAATWPLAWTRSSRCGCFRAPRTWPPCPGCRPTTAPASLACGPAWLLTAC
jgi:protein TonB